MKHLAALTKLQTLRCYRVNEPKLRWDLSQRTSFEFTETPLADACEFLAELQGVPIRLDEHAFAKAGLDPSKMKVTAVRSDEPFDDSLQSLLDPHSLVYEVTPSSLVITPAAAAAEEHRGIEALEDAVPSLQHVDVWWRPRADGFVLGGAN
jgi:hypothetical protein